MLGAVLKVIAVMQGDLVVGSEFDVSFFGRGSGGAQCKYPNTPDQKTLEYFVAGYVDDDGQRRLLEAPISKSLYDRWQQEILTYQLGRSRPDAQQ